MGGGLLNSASEKRQLREMVRTMRENERLGKDEVAHLKHEIDDRREKHNDLQAQHDVLHEQLEEENGQRIAHESALHNAIHMQKVQKELEEKDDPSDAESSSFSSSENSESSESSKDTSFESSSESSDEEASEEEEKPKHKRNQNDDITPDDYEVNGLELPKLRAQNNVVIVIPVNMGYIQFALNLICSLRRLKISNYVLLAMDKGVLSELRKRKLPVYVDPDLPFVTAKSAEWAEANFHKLVCTKLVPVTNLLKSGINVLLTDADIVWRRDPFPFVRDELSLTYSIGSCHKVCYFGVF